MRYSLVAFLLFAITFSAQALPAKKQKAIQTARQLAITLKSLSQQAQQVAVRAENNGRYLRARKFEDVSYQSQSLAWELRQAVIRPLRNGAPLRRAKQGLQSLAYQFQNLKQTINRILFMPPAMQNTVQQVKQLHRKLKQLLQGNGHGGGFIQGYCNLDIGGNFFLPKTQVQCTIHGQGAVAYIVKVNGYNQWQGPLNPHRGQQSFVTTKKKVGGYAAHYQVFVVLRSGQKKLIMSR